MVFVVDLVFLLERHMADGVVLLDQVLYLLLNVLACLLGDGL